MTAETSPGSSPPSVKTRSSPVEIPDVTSAVVGVLCERDQLPTTECHSIGVRAPDVDADAETGHRVGSDAGGTVEGVEDVFWEDRDRVDRCADGVGDRVGDRCRHRHHRGLGDALRSEGTRRVRMLQQNDLDPRDVGGQRKAVRLEGPLPVAAVGSDLEVLVQGVADALGDATLDLAERCRQG